MADIVQVDYESLTQLGRRFAQQAEAVDQVTQKIRHRAMALNGQWTGTAATQFFQKMDTAVYPPCDRLSQALYQAEQVTAEICQIMGQAEQDAAALFQADATSGIQGQQDGSVLGESDGGGGLFGKIGGTIIDIVKAANKVRPVAAAFLIASSLSLGKTYSGQIIVKAPAWAKKLGLAKTVKKWAGLSPNLTHIKAGNMAKHVATQAKKVPLLASLFAVGQGVWSIGNTWSANWDEYGSYTTSKRATAMTVDAALAALPAATELGGLVGGKIVGAKIGALAGTAIGGPVGTAAGAVIGGALGGIAGAWVGRHAGNITRDYIISSGWRDSAINVIDRKIAQPVADGISTTRRLISNIGIPNMTLPRIRFGW